VTYGIKNTKFTHLRVCLSCLFLSTFELAHDVSVHMMATSVSVHAWSLSAFVAFCCRTVTRGSSTSTSCARTWASTLAISSSCASGAARTSTWSSTLMSTWKHIQVSRMSMEVFVRDSLQGAVGKIWRKWHEPTKMEKDPALSPSHQNDVQSCTSRSV